MVDWTSAGTTLSRVSVGVQVATQLTWGKVVKDGAVVQYILHLGKRSIPLICPTIQYRSTSFWLQVLISFSHRFAWEN